MTIGATMAAMLVGTVTGTSVTTVIPTHGSNARQDSPKLSQTPTERGIVVRPHTLIPTHQGFSTGNIGLVRSRGVSSSR